MDRRALAVGDAVVAIRAKSGYLSRPPASYLRGPRGTDQPRGSRTSVESLTALLQNLAPLWWVLVAVIFLAALIAALLAAQRHARSARVPARVPAPAAPEADPEELDSSHIGFAPLVGSGPPQTAANAGAPARGEDAGGARR